MFQWLNHLLCRHFDIVTFDGKWMYLRCVKCSRETKGWTVEKR